ncbi:hypothetical protein CANARDRAFT_26940 [[Candida] arabinofermentans NRRL YB-2248]|uniref:Protein-S-isoprenylcysteine O-methyltransferase n=1 Tax=[Candida] arabinofermentans NRRL YB-2248 TaxID=983967 RepID=A0A1E4T737_9ASCO|nr:hypothetical protein CANARDRAFT_26940 [[Candida] arabinofermentans NRRL YB-2248]
MKISKSNETKILIDGGYEKGKYVTFVLITLHTLWYVVSISTYYYQAEYKHDYEFDLYSLIGLIVNLFGVVMLSYVVSILGEYWTVKLMIAKEHPLIRHPLFEYIKHPNYYLNIIPELAGLAILCHAWVWLAIAGPIYLIFLYLRIKEENVAIKEELIDTRLVQ